MPRIAGTAYDRFRLASDRSLRSGNVDENARATLTKRYPFVGNRIIVLTSRYTRPKCQLQDGVSAAPRRGLMVDTAAMPSATMDE
jgi:hypothetical protein